MGRNNADFQAGALFHGTVHPFKEGDIIKPMGGEEYAFATHHFDYALGRAEQAVDFSWEDLKKVNPTWNRPGGKQYDEYERETPPRVYQVEPIGDVQPDKQERFQHVKSKQGFRVVKQVK
jgi:hypothetical protein